MKLEIYYQVHSKDFQIHLYHRYLIIIIELCSKFTILLPYNHQLKLEIE